MVTTPAVPATEDSPEVLQKLNSSRNVGASKRLQSRVNHFNIQDVKTTLFWKLCQIHLLTDEKQLDFTTQGFYKMMNGYDQKHLQLQRAVNVQFLQQLQPEWSRFVYICEASTHQRAVNVVGARETVGGQVVQQSGIQCFNCKEFGHYAKECRKPKRVKDSTYHKEKMLLCKQAEKGVQLQAEQSDWLADTDEEIDEQELEAHYSYMAKIQEVPNADSGTDAEPLEQVQYDTDDNVFANDIQHFEQSESITNTCAVETGDSNVIPDSPDMCDNDIQDDQNDVECDDERVALANLIANLKLDVDENKKIQKQLKKANATLTQELTECKSILAETSRTLGESNSIRDSCLVALQNKQTEFERYKAFNDRTIDYDKLERKLNKTLGLLAQKEIDIKEGLKVKAYEIAVVKEKHDELVKQGLFTKSHSEGLVKEKTKVITDLKLKEEKDIDKMISMENQLKFLNEIVYKRSQSIQTIHMLAPKCPTFNGRPTFSNPRYLKKAQYEKPCLYAIPHDQSDPANRLIPDREEILTLEEESRSKLNKDLVKPFDYTNSTGVASQVGVSHNLTKPVTPHSWPPVRRSSFAKPNDVKPWLLENKPKACVYSVTKESIGSYDMVHYY
ncbi:integrase, catalytic region, zinc finger, CCHC-type containing protein [Tanacetum coccineum]|uniref:Integrase, catalytic region, zinc finger, CCHC-type containing protein n=1 Tax=Tanacetum coccineum TaxID=301880 RepID=A0ABQ5AQC2_9ASTR